MVRRAYRQRSLVEVLLPDSDKLWDSTLRQIDALLDDDVLVDRVAEALAKRHPQSRRRVARERPPRSSCACWSSSTSTTGASMSANERCGAAWSTARFAASTASGGKSVQALVRRLGEPASERPMIWPAHEKLTIRRVNRVI